MDVFHVIPQATVYYVLKDIITQEQQIMGMILVKYVLWGVHHATLQQTVQIVIMVFIWIQLQIHVRIVKIVVSDVLLLMIAYSVN